MKGQSDEIDRILLAYRKEIDALKADVLTLATAVQDMAAASLQMNEQLKLVQRRLRIPQS